MKVLLGRRQFALSGLIMLAACAAPLSRPTFKKYAGPPVTEVRVYKAQRRLQSNPKTVFLIGGAKDVPYDEIIKALNLLHSAGVKSVGLMTQPI